MKIAIISHTEHYKKPNGAIVGWGPTVTEINHLAPHFEKIYHIAFLHSTNPPPSAINYEAKNIQFVPLKPVGGKSIIEKLSILTTIPSVLKQVSRILKDVDAFQLRTPTGIGVYLIPFFTFFSKKKGWYKYAGNWKQQNAPLGYSLQRWMLKNQSRLVTINGQWEDQPRHCITFENPCLTVDERDEGLQIIHKKEYDKKLSFCFVGRLEDEKGVQRILDALKALKNRERISVVHFIGDGKKFEAYKEFANTHQLPVKFYGFLSRTSVFDIYRTCNFLLLPSTASEGFPKVIAEGMNYGCIPIVSSVSSIGQYVNPTNGFIVTPVTNDGLITTFEKIFSRTSQELKDLAISGHQSVKTFTFNHYTNRILEEVLKT